MDAAVTSALAMSLVSNRQPQDLEQWISHYEAMSLRQDWWFKVGAAAARWMRSAIVQTLAVTTPPALRAAHS